ncbi:MAG: transposase [Paludibacteraceae bacterium]|nr:transposase [Paludibacteraceae bacterium]
MKVDKKTKIITGYAVTSVNVHDSKEAVGLITEEYKGQEVWIDAGYTGLEDALTDKGVKPIICEKGFRNHPLTDSQKQSNREKSTVRS